MPPSAAIGRERHGPPIAELADDELALDLHPDDEEEHRHQQVVDDVERGPPRTGTARSRCGSLVDQNDS